LIDRVGAESILVLISSWMGPHLRRELSAEDIWQEALAMAWRDREKHTWRDLPSYRNWLLAIARNRVRDAVKLCSAGKRGGGRHIDSLSAPSAAQGDDGVGLPEQVADSLTPSRVAMRRERTLAMLRALRSLPVEYREAVRLRLFERMSLADVAASLGVSLATAKKRIYCGSRLYRDRLRLALSRSSSR